MRNGLLVLLLIACGLCGAAAGGEETVRSGPWELRFDDATGDWTALSWNGKPLLAENTATPAVDVQTEDGRWLQMQRGVEPRLLETVWHEDAATLILTRRAGDWTLMELVRFGADGNENRIARDLGLTWDPEGGTGAAASKFHGVMLSAALPKTGRYLVPTQIAQANGRGRCADLPIGQAANTSWAIWPMLIEPEDGLTLLCISDMRRDPGSTLIWSEDDRLRLVQDFHAEGWAERGVTQEVGTAFIEVVPAPLEVALAEAVWAWYDDVGLHVPPSRPDWVRDAVLYSFHPGGTIGSGFRDLGGFTAARENLLPIVERLGMGAVWALPIEDRSCYWPRDYYRFQPGLGSPQEYRALVDAAHEAGIRFWQDIVPHGGTPAFGQVRGNKPWWLAFDENGDAQSYWCWDFGEPHWQQYIAGVAAHYVRVFGIDGYRIDACGGNRITNWRRAGFPPRDPTPANVPEDYWHVSLDEVGGEVPALSYERGSLGRRQGGMEMIRTIREAVRLHQPETGAVLAEVENNPYMQEADVVYDFGLAHSVFPRLRRTDPAEGVPYLRTWLEEQKLAEPRGTTRLRYTESHDTVRARGLYGIAAARALRALTMWIAGMPMVYHDSDRGDGPFLQRAIAVRRALTELRRGEADYLAVETDPPYVFACLRRAGEDASIVLVNLSAEAATVRCAVPSGKLPGPLHGEAVLWDAMSGEGAGPLEAVPGSLSFSRAMRPWEATVLAIRPAGEAAPLPPPLEQEAARAEAPADGLPHVSVEAQTVTVTGTSYVMVLDAKTGLLRSWGWADGSVLLDHSDVLLGVTGVADAEFERELGEDGSVLRWIADLEGRGGIELTYRCRQDGVHLDALLTDETPGGRAGLIFRAPNAFRYRIGTAEGILDDWFSPRHSAGRPGDGGGIYYRRQGNEVIWEARRQPLSPAAPVIRVADADGRGVDIEVQDLLEPGPANVALFESFAGEPGWCAAFLWRDGAHHPLPSPAGARQLSLALRPSGPVAQQAETWEALECGGARLSHTSLNWIVENDHYRVALRRTGGVISSLRDKGTGQRVVLQDCDVYTDVGLNPPDVDWTGASADGETAVRVWREDDVLRMRFQGRLRGEHRFSLSQPPIWFVTEYAFDGSPTFRVNWSVLCEGDVRGDSAFLAWMGRLPGAAEFSLLRDGKAFVTERCDPQSRTGQTARLAGKPLPDAAVLRDAAGRTLVSLSEMAWRGPEPPHNVFVHGRSFFIAWLDTFDDTVTTGEWYQASMAVTPGDSAAAAAPPIDWLPESPASELDGTFELSSTQAVRLSDGTKVELPGHAPSSGWQIPAAGSLDAAVSHSGGNSAKIVNTSGDCTLFQHELPLSQYPPGTRLRLRAWVRGRDIVRGDSDWKAGMAGFSFAMPDGSWQHSPAEYVDGTFDWRELAIDAVVPPEAASARVRLGINGGTGTIWIDDVSLEQLP